MQARILGLRYAVVVKVHLVRMLTYAPFEISEENSVYEIATVKLIANKFIGGPFDRE